MKIRNQLCLTGVAATAASLLGVPAPAQAAVARWQAFISENFYPCTDEILAGLGQMYVSDERFQKNLDRRAEGLASFMSRAIAARGA